MQTLFKILFNSMNVKGPLRYRSLESMGLTVIRFNDADVKVDMNNVLMAIEGWIERNNPLPPFSKGELPTHFEKEPK